MNVTDFNRSYVRWSIAADPTDARQPGHMPWGNSVRIQIDATCTISHDPTGDSAMFYLIAPCRKEWMYRETGLIMDPGGEYRMIFSRGRQRDVAMSMVGQADRPLPTATDAFTSLDFELITVPAIQLRSDEDVVRASQEQAPIVARTEITNAEHGLATMLEYPVRTMNFHPERQRFQVDTGPLIFPDLAVVVDHPLDCCQLAHTVYNTFDYAEFVCRRPIPLDTGGFGGLSIFPYSEVHRLPVRNELFAMSGLQHHPAA